MRLGALTGRFGRAVLLLAVGAVAGAAAAAIAAVPGSDGAIHACYQVEQDGTTPVTGGPNVRIIDPSAGQSCNPAGAPAAPEHALSWNVTGPPGPEGATGSPGAQGTTGPQGAGGPAGAAVSIDGQAFTLGDGKTLTASSSPVPPLEAAPGGPKVATMTLGNGGGATTSGVLAWQLVGGPGAAARGIQIVKRLDKASPTLFKACVNGKHFQKVVITVRKASAGGGPQSIVLTGATVESYRPYDHTVKGGSGIVEEHVSFAYKKIKFTYDDDESEFDVNVGK
jgi:type VI protein secretion system component Hcp